MQPLDRLKEEGFMQTCSLIELIIFCCKTKVSTSPSFCPWKKKGKMSFNNTENRTAVPFSWLIPNKGAK